MRPSPRAPIPALLAAAMLFCAASVPAAGQSDAERYVDPLNLPGVRTDPRASEEADCFERYVRIQQGPRAGLTGGVERICVHNGVTFRTFSPSSAQNPYGPPVGGYSGLGGRDFRR